MQTLYPFNACVQGRRSETCHEIEQEVFLRSPDPFEHAAEHVEGEHVEKHVPEASVHEHVRDKLPPVEIRRLRIEKSELLVHEVRTKLRNYPDQEVNDNYVSCHRRDSAEESPSAVVFESELHSVFCLCREASHVRN